MASGAASMGSAGVRVRISSKVCTMCTPSPLFAPPAHFTQRRSSCKAEADHQVRWAGARGGEGSVIEVLERRGEDVDLRWWLGWRCLGERERRWRGLGVEDGYGRRGDLEGEVDMRRRWRTWWRLGEREWWMGMRGGQNGEPGGACGGRGRWTWGGCGVPGGAGGSGSGGGGDWGWGSCTARGGRGRWTWGGGGAHGDARGGGSGRSGVLGGRGGAWGSRSAGSGWLRRGGGVGSVGAGGECAVRGGAGSAAVCGTGPHRSSRASQEASAGLGGPRVVPPGTGGGGFPCRPWIRHVGVWWRQRLVVWVE